MTTRSGLSSLNGLTLKNGLLLKSNPVYKKFSLMQTWFLTPKSLSTIKLKGMKKMMLYDSSVQDIRISIKTYSFNDFNVCVYLFYWKNAHLKPWTYHSHQYYQVKLSSLYESKPVIFQNTKQQKTLIIRYLSKLNLLDCWTHSKIGIKFSCIFINETKYK